MNLADGAAMNTKPHLHELTPTEVHHALHDQSIVLIDVREPQEYITERILRSELPASRWPTGRAAFPDHHARSRHRRGG